MEVKDKVLLHFNHRDRYTDIWVPGNELVIDDNYSSECCDLLHDRTNFIIRNYIESLKENDPEKLWKACKVIRDTKADIGEIYQREVALEILRILKYPDLPSRKHSLFLCDEKSKRHWKDSLDLCNGIGLDLFVVSVTGKLFKSSDVFIPCGYGSLDKTLEDSKKYWKPDFKTNVEDAQAEYLFQGNVKILKKINKF